MQRVTATLPVLVLIAAGITGSSSPVASVPMQPPAAEVASGRGAPDAPYESAGPEGSSPTAVFLPDTAAHIVSVGLNPDGSMEIPDEISEVGWYSLTGIRPGDSGTAVLAGHVDSRTQGHGPFNELSQLTVGDEITIDTVNGAQTWTVTSTAAHPRADLPIADLFSLDGPPRLALVTCGGDFDRDERSYEDNIVVYAHRTDIDA